MLKKDPNYCLPDSPKHPAYAQALKIIMHGDPVESAALARYMALNDFWFFCRYVLTVGRVLCDDPHSELYGESWFDHPWIFARCREIQESPNGWVDLWPRYHWKTSIITQSYTLWELAEDSNLTFAIFTYKVDGAGETFLSQIKNECQDNPKLHQLFPDSFWLNPQKEALAAGKLWTNSALVMPRELNPREPSITVVSLVGSQPVSQHYDRMVYDDIVTRDNVSAELVKKTNLAWQQSSALGKVNTAKRYIGTRWAVSDTWDFIINKKKAAKLRRHDVYDQFGKPVLYSEEWIEGCDGCGKCNNQTAGVRREMGRSVFSAQIRNEPIVEGDQVFDIGWIQWYDLKPAELGGLNVYIFMDTARVNKVTADYTAIAVIGVGAGTPHPSFYLLDLVRDRLTLPETTEILFSLARQWKPKCTFVEQVGAMRDIEHFKDIMLRDGFRFEIAEFYEKMKKEERIRRLQHYFEVGAWWFPKCGILRKSDGDFRDLVHVLRDDEMRDWTPAGTARHDDMLDVLSWVHSPGTNGKVMIPVAATDEYKRPLNRRVSRMKGSRTSWSN